MNVLMAMIVPVMVLLMIISFVRADVAVVTIIVVLGVRFFVQCLSVTGKKTGRQKPAAEHSAK